MAEQSRTIRLPVHIAEATSTLARVQRQLLQDLGREPTPDELAAGLDMTPEKLIEVQKYAREPISLHTPLGEDGGSELGDLIEDSEAIQPAEAARFSSRKVTGNLGADAPDSPAWTSTRCRSPRWPSGCGLSVRS